MVFGLGEMIGIGGGVLFSGGAAKKRKLIYKKAILPAYRTLEATCCHINYKTLLIRDAEEEHESAKKAAEEAAAALEKARANKVAIDAAAADKGNSYFSWVINSCRGAPGDLTLAQVNAANIVTKFEKAEKAAAELAQRRENTVRQLKAGEEVTTTFTPAREENNPPEAHLPMVRDNTRKSSLFLNTEEGEEKEQEEGQIRGIELGHLNMAVIGASILSPKSKMQQSKEELNKLLGQAQETLITVSKWQAQVKAHLKKTKKVLKELEEKKNPNNSPEYAANLLKVIKAEEFRVKFQTVKANILQDKATKAKDTAEATKKAIEAILAQFENSNEVAEDNMVQARELAVLSTEADKLVKTAASELIQFIIAEHLKSSSSHHKIQEFFVQKAVAYLQEEFAGSPDPRVAPLLQHLADIIRNREDLNMARSLRVALEKHFANTEAGRIKAEIRKVTAQIDKLEKGGSTGHQAALQQKALSEKARLDDQFVKAIAVKPTNAAINIADILDQITAVLERKPSEGLTKELREKERLKNQTDLQKAKALLAGISDAQLHLEIANKAVVIDGIITKLKAQGPIKAYFAELVLIRNLKEIQDFTEELSKVEAVNDAAIAKLAEIRQNVNAGNEVKKHMQLFLEMKQGHVLIVKAQALINKLEQNVGGELIVNALKAIQNGVREWKPIKESTIEFNLITRQLKEAATEREMARRAALEQEESESDGEGDDGGVAFPVLNTVIGWIPGGSYFLGNNNIEVRYMTDVVYANQELVANLLTGKDARLILPLEDVVYDKTLVTDEDFAAAIMAINLNEVLGKDPVVEKENIQDVIDKLEQIVGEDISSESKGFHQYIAQKSSHSVITKLVESLNAFSQMKGFFETAGNVASQSEEYHYLVEAISRAATIFQIGINDRLDTIANGPMSVMVPRHPHFGPDDDSDGGPSGGGGSYYEGNDKSSDTDSDNIVTLLLGELTNANSYYERGGNSSDTSNHDNKEAITVVLGGTMDTHYY